MNWLSCSCSSTQRALSENSMPLLRRSCRAGGGRRPSFAPAVRRDRTERRARLRAQAFLADARFLGGFEAGVSVGAVTVGPVIALVPAKEVAAAVAAAFAVPA